MSGHRGGPKPAKAARERGARQSRQKARSSQIIAFRVCVSFSVRSLHSAQVIP